MPAIYLNQAAVNCSLGQDLLSVEENLFGAGQSSFMTMTDQYSPGAVLPLGLVKGNLPAVDIAGEDTRNNRLLASAVRPLLGHINRLKSRYRPERIGLVIGTSTSGIADAEEALVGNEAGFHFETGYYYDSQEFSAPVRFLSRWLGVRGPAWVVSTACTSGGKALASAARLLQMGACDAVIAGGVDTLCRMTVAGFSSLLVTSDKLCNPFSLHRRGINIGEAAAVFIVSRQEGPVRLAGFGESSDAYHISSPDPDGRGAEIAIKKALAVSGINAADIDYINLHGTATEQNDKMESLVVNRIFGPEVACSSTKPLTGHTLAAAGAVEALFCWQLLQRSNGSLPPHVWDGVTDPVLATLNGLGRPALAGTARYAMSNSFAFGGNNLSLILARE
ncbi:MAG: beta-ketoacyl-ACP synthase [Gammaproteobacteria bacterium]|nr:beta-ketoacyl-ACP synthase [Gammaproteobacteria bacterium]